MGKRGGGGAGQKGGGYTRALWGRSAGLAVPMPESGVAVMMQWVSPRHTNFFHGQFIPVCHHSSTPHQWVQPVFIAVLSVVTANTACPTCLVEAFCWRCSCRKCCHGMSSLPAMAGL